MPLYSVENTRYCVFNLTKHTKCSIVVEVAYKSHPNRCGNTNGKTATYTTVHLYVITNDYKKSILCVPLRKEIIAMAKTKSSCRGVQKKKIVTVKGYTTKDGTKVRPHRRSTPN